MPAPIVAAWGWAAAHKWLTVPVAIAFVIAAIDYVGTAYGIGILAAAAGSAIYVIVRGAAWGRAEWRKAAAGDALSKIETVEARLKGVSAEFSAYRKHADDERGWLGKEIDRLTREAEAANARASEYARIDLIRSGFVKTGPVPSPDDSALAEAVQ